MTDITRAEFDRFLSAKAPRRPCPECSINDWSAPALDDSIGADSVVYIGGPISLTGSIMMMVNLVCNNCGYVKTFDTDPIRRWLRCINSALEALLPPKTSEP